MKIAIPVISNNPETQIDSRFGRALYFMVYDSDTDVTTFIDNSNSVNASHGAGIGASNNLINPTNQVNAVITPSCGPKAFNVLQMAGVKVYQPAQGTIKENIKLLLEGKLAQLTGPVY
ncbi:MAG: NifB/NifX family molybdenum-iron cluster-binding protein [Candidatus Cloacimonetes bacterium]|jgi:predicted Fe-Mo cluster-binding NifX family protein|nr:NifB/NifX family molybdenum-iron cluster-binding protein [Candidatus Cloacimonadota bacterium]MDD4156927.1 NifB/NifX family molybdenum-iron cluster-binding protein [Candidatus Cloacimonadota bacterium]